MHVLFIGYGKTSRRVAQHLFEQDHQITTISRTKKTDGYAKHVQQDIHALNLTKLAPIDAVYILLAPDQKDANAYRETFVEPILNIQHALAEHPLQKVIVVSSTRVYGEKEGEYIDDTTAVQPNDEQGHILREMELAWQTAYPKQTIIVRPTGIYGTSVQRMVKLACTTSSYPNRHWSNRIHIEDLAAFLAYLLTLKQPQASYICSDSLPIPQHEIIQWFQQQLHKPQLTLVSKHETGKRIIATRMQQLTFKLRHQNCFESYLKILQDQEI